MNSLVFNLFIKSKFHNTILFKKIEKKNVLYYFVYGERIFGNRLLRDEEQ